MRPVSLFTSFLVTVSAFLLNLSFLSFALLFVFNYSFIHSFVLSIY